MELEFTGEIWEWRGPAPHHFVSVPDDLCPALKDASPLVSYGWGMIPAVVHVGRTRFETALWPKDGGYIVPVKAAVRKAEAVGVGDPVTVRLFLDV